MQERERQRKTKAERQSDTERGRKGIYWHHLEPVVQLIQPLLSMKRTSKSPEVAQSPRLAVSAGLQCMMGSLEKSALMPVEE